ncbi:YqaJ viral recombinase family protein [Bariatricus sp. HCP28S3_D3]|uniref:YqaJ viral recombinase family nuclease n=1 Tax=Bariatricus sp. HCP28S3_D3 TaxID=3438901 RepID=UPI003F8CA738
MNLKKLVSTVGMSHEEWLAHRKNGIGGSDAGAICGLNPYKSAVAVYLDKTSAVTEAEDNEHMRQGRDLEQYVAQRFMEDTGKKVRKANAIFVHPEHDFMFANVDRLIVGEDAGLECKTASAYAADKWKDGKIPAEYELQCHHYMAVTGASAWYIACVILGQQFVWQKIERDEETIQMLIELESDFWNNNVLVENMPSPDGSEDADKVIKEKYAFCVQNKCIDLFGFDDKLNRRKEIIELEEKLKKEKNQIEQEIKIFMDDAEKAESKEYSVNWKTVNRNGVDSEKLKKEYPDIYKKCMKTSSSRRFTVKEIA